MTAAGRKLYSHTWIDYLLMMNSEWAQRVSESDNLIDKET